MAAGISWVASNDRRDAPLVKRRHSEIRTGDAEHLGKKKNRAGFVNHFDFARIGRVKHDGKSLLYAVGCYLQCFFLFHGRFNNKNRLQMKSKGMISESFASFLFVSHNMNKELFIFCYFFIDKFSFKITCLKLSPILSHY